MTAPSAADADADAPRLYAGSAAYARSGARVLTIGNFDGVRQGHRRLPDAVRRRAAPRGADRRLRAIRRRGGAHQHHQPRICPWPDKITLLGTPASTTWSLSGSPGPSPSTLRWFADVVLGQRINPGPSSSATARFGRAQAAP